MNNKTSTFRKDNISLGQMGTESPWELQQIPILWTPPFPPRPLPPEERDVLATLGRPHWIGWENNVQKKLTREPYARKQENCKKRVPVKLEVLKSCKATGREEPPFLLWVRVHDRKRQLHRCTQNRIFNHWNKVQTITSIFWLIIIPSVALIKSRINRLELGSITEKKCAQLLTIALVTSCKLEEKKLKQENILNIRHLRNERETGSSLLFAKTSGTVTGEFKQQRSWARHVNRK